MTEPLRAGYFVWYDPRLLFMSANLFFRSPHMSDFTVQELTLGQLLENTAARFPDTDAVIHADRELRQTWSEFSACVDDMARGLMAIGVQKGEKVAVWATNVPHWVTLMFATARIGAILVTVNTNYRETELRYLLQQSECWKQSATTAVSTLSSPASPATSQASGVRNSV